MFVRYSLNGRKEGPMPVKSKTDLQTVLDELVWKFGDLLGRSDRGQIVKKHKLSLADITEARMDLALRHCRERSFQAIRDINAKGSIQIIVPGEPEFDPAYEMDPYPSYGLSYEQHLARIEEGTEYSRLKRLREQQARADKDQKMAAFRKRMAEIREEKAREKAALKELQSENPFTKKGKKKVTKVMKTVTPVTEFQHEVRPSGACCG
jgi:hypothetical protein